MFCRACILGLVFTLSSVLSGCKEAQELCENQVLQPAQKKLSDIETFFINQIKDKVRAEYSHLIAPDNGEFPYGGIVFLVTNDSFINLEGMHISFKVFSNGGVIYESGATWDIKINSGFLSEERTKLLSLPFSESDSDTYYKLKSSESNTLKVEKIYPNAINFSLDGKEHRLEVKEYFE